MFTEMIIKYIFSRLQEASTIRGLIAFIGGLAGYSFSANTTENLVYIILGLIGLIGTLLPDKVVKKDVITPINNSPEEKIIEPSNEKEIETPIGWNDSTPIINPTIVQHKSIRPKTPVKVQSSSSVIRKPEEQITESSGFNDK